VREGSSREFSVQENPPTENSKKLLDFCSVIPLCCAVLFREPWTEEREGMKIVVSDNQVDKALRVLKKKLIKEGLLKEMKKREYYEKPSVKRKRKEKESRKRLRKLQTRKTTP